MPVPNDSCRLRFCWCRSQAGAEATGVGVEFAEAGGAEFEECVFIEPGDLCGRNHAAKFHADPAWLRQEPRARPAFVGADDRHRHDRHTSLLRQECEASLDLAQLPGAGPRALGIDFTIEALRSIGTASSEVITAAKGLNR